MENALALRAMLKRLLTTPLPVRSLVVALALGALTAGAVACADTQGGDDAAVPNRGIRIAVGEPFLDFTVKDADGNDFTLSSLKGKPILLNVFRGHW